MKLVGMRLFFIFTLLLFHHVAGMLFAQTLQYNFSHLDNNAGLSNNQVRAIIKDDKGFMWFGTMSGLNRYDGVNIKIFKHLANDTNSINDNFVTSITEDYNKNIWVNTRLGYNVYNTLTERFSHTIPEYVKNCPFGLDQVSRVYSSVDGNLVLVQEGKGVFITNFKTAKSFYLRHIANNTASIASNTVTSVAQDAKGDFWMIHANGTLEQISSQTCKVVFRQKVSINSNADLQYYELYIDSDNDIWVMNTSTPQGLVWIQHNIRTCKPLTNSTAGLVLNSNFVQSICEVRKGIIWVGTDHGGVNIIDKVHEHVSYILSDPENEKSLSQNSIPCIYRDINNIVWLGTFKKGVSYYHENLVRFTIVKRQPTKTNGLGFDDINCFAEDKDNNLWIGTNNGGLYYYNRKNDTYKHYKHEPGHTNSIANDIIVELYVDKQNNLWIGTYYGGLDVFDGQQFTHFKHNPNDNSSICDDRIWEIFEDADDNFWIGTLGGGVDLFDRKKKVFYHFREEHANSVKSNYVLNISQDKNGDLWFATANGIDVLEKATKKFVHYSHETDNSNSLSNFNCLNILFDRRNLVWIGTRDGLNMFDKKTKKFRVFLTKDGLPDNTIQTLVEDNNGTLWIGTSNGLSNLIVTPNGNSKFEFMFRNYDISDGLQGKEYNERSVFKTRKGEILFGGANGFNIFDPEKIKINAVPPKVVLTTLQIFNKDINAGDVVNGREVLDSALSVTPKIVLKYRENIFSLGFAALDFMHPEKNKYQYKLEGLNNQWLDVDASQRHVTFTSLNPGTYVFRVRASNDDGLWNTKGATLQITVLPPFYRTFWAFLIYAVVIFLVLLLARNIIVDRARMKFNIENERKEAMQMHELDLMKIRFFTNISHELRTPLALIIAPLEKIMKLNTNEEQVKQFGVMYRNARRLLNLVNQLLDVRRMEVQEFKFIPSHTDIVYFLKDIIASFTDIAEKKNITLTFQSDNDSINMVFDMDKMEKVMFNLLSNAFKFTHEEGQIAVTVKRIAPKDAPHLLQICVSDTGIGIPGDKHEKIFEQFFQNDTPGNLINMGSGVGLSLVKEFVKLHNGTVKVTSEIDKGSMFVVTLPLRNEEDFLQPVYENDFAHMPVTEADTAVDEKDLHFTILIVEDNDDLRFYLKDNLKARYKIEEAADGKEGLAKALHIVPDIIVSDVMMPKMNGIELCKLTKADKRTSHIPIILLTAKASDEQKIAGLEVGADDYITKPFNFEILESRIRYLVNQRNDLRKNINRQIEINPGIISVTSVDEKLIRKAIELVEKHIANPDFSVEEMSRELGMSRVHLYKKISSLTGKSPIEFIRILRLKRAAQLLKESQLTVAEIAFQVGFNNPKYFSKYFKDEFKELPSVYQSKREL